MVLRPVSAASGGARPSSTLPGPRHPRNETTSTDPHGIHAESQATSSNASGAPKGSTPAGDADLWLFSRTSQLALRLA